MGRERHPLFPVESHFLPDSGLVGAGLVGAMGLRVLVWDGCWCEMGAGVGWVLVWDGCWCEMGAGVEMLGLGAGGGVRGITRILR